VPAGTPSVMVAVDRRLEVLTDAPIVTLAP